jgi:hypothetical protein
MIRKHFRLKRVLLGLAFALVAAPTAQAYTGLTVDGPPQGIQSDARHAALLTRHNALSQLPIASKISVQPAAYQSKSKNSAQGPVSVKSVSTAGSDGFNWNDAGIGASVAFGVALLLLLSVAIGRRTRSDGNNLAST